MRPSIKTPILLALALTLSLAFACSPEAEEEPDQAHLGLHTPRWAFETWISKDISDSDDTRDFVQGFRERDIPVGVVVIDSPWATDYNTFIPNPSRYPKFDELVAELREDGVRVVMWTTQMVNESSFDLEPGGDTYPGPAPNFEEGIDNDYFVNGGETSFWWKGMGAALDFFNPKAVKWWRKQQDHILDMGISGWKLDFGEDYIETFPIQTAQGEKSLQEYSEEYYRESLAYGLKKRGRGEFVTMVRPWDESYGYPGRFYARKEDAPVSWVGDNRRDWLGLVDALDHVFRSAKAGYLVIGSDIGGYLDRDDVDLLEIIPFDTEVFLRWTALGAMMPFMQLHGRANITPWTVPERAEESEAAWRYWSWLHKAMIPFYYSLSEEGIAGKGTIIRPIGDTVDDWQDDWRYQLGEAFLVAPIIDESGIRDVKLPEGAGWYDWWQPSADKIPGGFTLSEYDVGGSIRIPVFVREGAIVPMEIENAHNGLGSKASKGKLSVLIYPPEEGKKSHFVLHDEDDEKTQITTQGSSITLSRTLRNTLLRIRADDEVIGVKLQGKSLSRHYSRKSFESAKSGFWEEQETRSLWVKVPKAKGEQVVEVK